jgi:hypothetical protein
LLPVRNTTEAEAVELAKLKLVFSNSNRQSLEVRTVSPARQGRITVKLVSPSWTETNISAAGRSRLPNNS